MDITPELHLFESRKNDRLGWHDCLAELIDNSFDAGASRAVIEWKDGKFSVEDDGRGMSDLSAALRLGGHKKQETTALGMYGIGMKDAWSWLSNDIAIRTTRDGMTTTLHVARNKIEQIDGKWICPDPQSRTATAGEIGTRIVFGPLYANRKTASQESFDRLAVTFMPAILSGKQIVRSVKGRRMPIIPYRLPAMQEAVEESFDVDGRPVSIHVGIAQEGERIEQPGFLICYKHRVIKVSDIGTKHYNADRVIGRIILGHGWQLTPHKNDFSDHSEELEDAVFARIQHLLAKSDRMSDIVESNALRAELESMVNESLRDANAQEKRPGRSEKQFGTALPASTGRRRKKAAEFDPLSSGSVEQKTAKRRGLQIKWGYLGPVVLGKCYPETRTVMLNLENHFVDAMKAAKNRPALYAIAIGLLCHVDDMMDGPQRLVVPRGEFAESWGSVMAGMKTVEASQHGDNH